MLKRSFYEWLSAPIATRKIPTVILLAIIIDLVWIFFSVPIILSFVKLPELLSGTDIIWWTPLAIAADVFLEELFFRGPLYVDYIRKDKARLYIGIAISCVVFGLAHGTVFNIFEQGVTGIIFTLLFLKGGAMQGKFWRGLGMSFAAHFLIDCILWSLFVLYS